MTTNPTTSDTTIDTCGDCGSTGPFHEAASADRGEPICVTCGPLQRDSEHRLIDWNLSSEIDMDAISAAVNAEGIACYVEMSGGGVATLYVGDRQTTTETMTNGRDVETFRYAAIAGPGWFNGPGYTIARAHREDFYVGPDDDGESTPWSSTRATTDAEIVAKIVETAKAAR